MLVFAVGGQRRFLLTLIKRATQEKNFQKDAMPGGDGCGLCHSGLTGDGMMFDSRNIPDDLMTNGQYYPFRSWASITTWVIL